MRKIFKSFILFFLLNNFAFGGPANKVCIIMTEVNNPFMAKTIDCVPGGPDKYASNKFIFMLYDLGEKYKMKIRSVNNSGNFLVYTLDNFPY